MASGHTGNVVPGNRLRVRLPCPPLLTGLALDIHEEQVQNQAVAITNLDHNLIAIHLNSKLVSEKV